MNINSIKSAIRNDDFYEPITKLICIENTHNICGGKILPMSFLRELRSVADSYDLPVHLDGARV